MSNTVTVTVFYLATTENGDADCDREVEGGTEKLEAAVAWCCRLCQQDQAGHFAGGAAQRGGCGVVQRRVLARSVVLARN